MKATTTMESAKSVASSLVGSVMKRAVWKAEGNHLGGRRRTRFDETDVRTWVESPDIGQKGSFTAGEITSSVAQDAVGAKYPGNGKDADFRVGGEIVIIPRLEKYKYDVCIIDGKNFTFKRRGAVLDAAANVVPFNWDDFMEVVNKYSHPENPGEWNKYVAKIYGWVQGGNRASMKDGVWTPAPLRPDETIPDDEKCELLIAALSALDEAHETSAKLREEANKRPAAFWNRKRLEEKRLAEASVVVLRVDGDDVADSDKPTPMRPPTLLRSTSCLRVCEAYDAAAAAALEEDHRRRDEKDLVHIMD